MTTPPECPPSLPGDTSPACAGGTCLSRDACECDTPASGYTGFGDFQFGSPSCALRVDVVRGLWGFLAALECVLFLFTVYYLHVKVTRTRAVSPRASGRWTRSNLPSLVIGVGVLLEGLWIGICAILKASDPERRTIGSDLTTSIAFSLGTASFWCASHVFTYHFVMVNLRQSRIKSPDWKHKISDLTRRMKIALPVNTFFTVLGCFSPTIATVSTNSEMMYAFAACHFMVCGFAMASLGLVLIPYFLTPLIHDIKASINTLGEVSSSAGASAALIENNHNNVPSAPSSPTNLSSNVSSSTVISLRALLKKIVFFKSELQRQAVVNVVLAVIFGLWTTPQRYTSYFLVFPWFSGMLVSVLALYLNLPTGSSPASGAGGGGAPVGGSGAAVHNDSSHRQHNTFDGNTFSSSRRGMGAKENSMRAGEPSTAASSSFRRNDNDNTKDDAFRVDNPASESAEWSSVMVAPGGGGGDDEDV